MRSHSEPKSRGADLFRRWQCDFLGPFQNVFKWGNWSDPSPTSGAPHAKKLAFPNGKTFCQKIPNHLQSGAASAKPRIHILLLLADASSARASSSRGRGGVRQHSPLFDPSLPTPYPCLNHKYMELLQILSKNTCSSSAFEPVTEQGRKQLTFLGGKFPGASPRQLPHYAESPVLRPPLQILTPPIQPGTSTYTLSPQRDMELPASTPAPAPLALQDVLE